MSTKREGDQAIRITKRTHEIIKKLADADERSITKYLERFFRNLEPIILESEKKRER